MRYAEIDTVSYEDVNGNIKAVKDMREYPSYTLKDKVKLRVGDRVDEIVTRAEHYGDDAEGESYKVVDFNIEEIYEEKFDLSRIRTLGVPLR